MEVLMARCNKGEIKTDYEWERRLQMRMSDQITIKCWLIVKKIKTFHQLVNGTCTNVNSKQISKIVDIHSAKYLIKMYASV